LLSKTGKDSLGTVELEKAIALDPATNCELWADIAKIWSKAKNHTKAIAAWEKRATCAKPLSGQENFENGRSFYFEAGAKIRQKKEAEAPALFGNADSCFAKLTRSAATFPAGYFWRGKVNSQLDPKNERWQAKPYYEKGLSLVKPEEKTATYKKDVIEALEYLGNYYVVQKDKEKSDATFNELKTIDPNNEKAKNYFAPPKK
jgi:tetratricopeptide (TPR) repeat protein